MHWNRDGDLISESEWFCEKKTPGKIQKLALVRLFYAYRVLGWTGSICLPCRLYRTRRPRHKWLESSSSLEHPRVPFRSSFPLCLMKLWNRLSICLLNKCTLCSWRKLWGKSTNFAWELRLGKIQVMIWLIIALMLKGKATFQGRKLLL